MVDRRNGLELGALAGALQNQSLSECAAASLPPLWLTLLASSLLIAAIVRWIQLRNVE